MPTYAFACSKCEKIVDNMILKITHTDSDLPVCCGKTMGYHITQPPLVHWNDPVIEPFRNPAAKRGDKDAVIQTTKQRKEFMAKNDLVDANDFKPVTRKEELQTQKEIQRSIAEITPTGAVKAEMDRRGMTSIID
jgi:hypothetical protein